MAIPKNTDIEPDGTGIDRTKGSVTSFRNSGTQNPGVMDNKPAPNDLLFKVGENYNSSKAGQEEDPKDKKKSAVSEAKKQIDKRVPKNLKANNPTAASQPPGKEIIEAVMGADPSNIAGAVQKALHAMMMIKMMDKLSSPAGIASMAAGALGGGLGGLAKAVGTGAMLGGLGSAMSALQGSLPGPTLGALNLGMQGMVSGNPVGALAAASVAAAADTVSTLVGAASSIVPADAINAAVKLGGPALGLTPGDLAYRVALATPGTTIKTSALIRGVAVASTLEVVDSFIQDQLGTIPQLAGDEHISIATDHIPVMGQGIGGAIVGTLHEAGMIAGDIAGSYLGGAVSNITGGLATAVGSALGSGNIGGELGNALGGAIGGAISGGVSGIVDAGLTKLLGAPLSGMMGVASSLLPNIAGDLLNNVAAFKPPSIPGFPSISMPAISIPGISLPSIPGLPNIASAAIGGLQLDTKLTGAAEAAIKATANETVKTLGLAAQGFKITSVFGPGLAEQVADLHDSMIGGVVKNAIAGAVSGAVSGALSNAFPTTMVAQCNGVKITVTAGKVNPAAAAVAGAITGAFSRL